VSRRVIGVAVAVALLIAVIWSFAVRSPQSKAISRAHAQQAAATQQVAALQTQTAELLKQKAKLPAVRAQLAALQLALPAEAAIDQVIDAVHLAATKSGVDLLNLSQSAATAATTTGGSTTGTLQQVALTMSTSGSYAQVTDFVNTLNVLARTTVVDNLSLSNSSAGNMTAAISGRMFYVPTGS
jgi:Tfp pilus assembly protein PilO